MPRECLRWHFWPGTGIPARMSELASGTELCSCSSWLDFPTDLLPFSFLSPLGHLCSWSFSSCAKRPFWFRHMQTVSSPKCIFCDEQLNVSVHLLFQITEAGSLISSLKDWEPLLLCALVFCCKVVDKTRNIIFEQLLWRKWYYL